MNQPSVEEKIADILSEVYPGIGRLTMAVKMAKAILDRYHLIDKTEPVSGAVTKEEIEQGALACFGTGVKFENVILNVYDIYPKGTVARLEGENSSLSREIVMLRTPLQYDRPIEPFSESENPEQWAVIAEYETERAYSLQAEVDRLKGELENEKRISETTQRISRVLESTKKPEAVGCGRWGEWGVSAFTVRCGDQGHFCPDCQAKATKKVSLPEVPFLAGSSNRNWAHDVSRFLQAVKQWIEAQGSKP